MVFLILWLFLGSSQWEHEEEAGMWEQRELRIPSLRGGLGLASSSPGSNIWRHLPQSQMFMLRNQTVQVVVAIPFLLVNPLNRFVSFLPGTWIHGPGNLVLME